jgi:hypothetical protein
MEGKGREDNIKECIKGIGYEWMLDQIYLD